MYCPKCQRPLPEELPANCPHCGIDLTHLAVPHPDPSPEKENTGPVPVKAEKEDTGTVPVKAEKAPGGRNPLMIVFAAVLVVALLGALVFGGITLLGKKSGNRTNDAAASGDTGKQQETASSVKAPEPGIHTYEFVQSTCTWHEARQRAADSGGHLVCFETPEEYAYVLGLLEEQAPLCYFRIGARRDLEGTKYYWTDGADELFGQALNDDSAWCAAVWKEGEPNITWKDTVEAYVVLRYNWDTSAWDWIDVADAPSEGLNPETVGYIVEYEP